MLWHVHVKATTVHDSVTAEILRNVWYMCIKLMMGYIINCLDMSNSLIVCFYWLLVCPAGFTGDYCEIDIDDCAGAQCHHYSTCVDLVNNYTCSCGPRWSGRLCDIFLGSLCNKTNNNNTDVCENGGICRDTLDKNNYTCTCYPGFTGRNCELEFNPCDSSPCEQGGTCSKFSVDDFKCDCPLG